MKKAVKIFFKAFAFALIAAIFIGGEAYAKDIDILLDGEKLSLEAPPIMENGETLIPFRNVFEALGFEVSWDNDAKAATAKKPGTEIKLQIDSAEIFVNGESVAKSSAPRLVDSTTYAPLEMIAECSVCDVLFCGEENAALLYSKRQPYEPCVQGTYSIAATDGEYIYTRGDDKVYRFKEDLTREDLPFSCGNEITVTGNKFYTRGADLHYKSIDLDTFEEVDLSGESVVNCCIDGDKIYYGLRPMLGQQASDEYGLYSMNLDGSGKECVIDNAEDIWDFFIKDGYIFSDGKIISLSYKNERVITDKFVTATALEGKNYYIAVNEYTDERTPLEPLGVIRYNYETDEETFFPFDREICSMRVTENSVFLTYENSDYSDEGYFTNYSYLDYINNSSLVRLTKNFEYPVVLRDNIYGDVLYVFGNYVYFQDRHIPESYAGFSRIRSDGGDFVNLDEYWEKGSGVDITYVCPEGYEEHFGEFAAILKNRLAYLGFSDAVVTENANSTCVVSISDIKDWDAAELAEILCSVGKLTFEDADGAVILTNEDVLRASAEYEPLYSNDPINYILIELTEEGAKKFADATERVSKAPAGKDYISINLDGTLISAPVVSEKIEGGAVVISGDFMQQSVKELAALLNFGVMPFKAEAEGIERGE